MRRTSFHLKLTQFVLLIVQCTLLQTARDTVEEKAGQQMASSDKLRVA